MLRVLRVLAVALIAPTLAAARQPVLDDVLARLDKYLQQYEELLVSVVAEERYTQKVFILTTGSQIERRVLVSDYALARAPGGQAWTGFRDTYDVDGKPVRDREQRLADLLASGSAESAAQARRITRENARFNLGDDVATRTINVPTVALDLVHPRNRKRFSVRRGGQDTIDGTPTWRIQFDERTRPTLIRGLSGGDQRARLSVWVNPANGEVMRTTLQWDNEPRGFITVQYRNDAGIGGLVPASMVEQYSRNGLRVDGEAVYTNYRRFQTSARIVP